MARDWSVVPIAEAPLNIIDGDRGVNYPKQEDFAPRGDCLFLNAGNVTAAGFRFEDCSFITSDKDAILRKGKLQRHDIVLTTRGTVGNVALFDETVPYEQVRINSGMVLFRTDRTELSPRFLYQVLRSSVFKDQVAALTTGSAQPQLPIRDILRLRIPLPPLAEQTSIAHILGTLDDKIDLNRRMSATLEEMARALFKSWFVDFDPVRAKAEGRLTGLPPEIDTLFPDSLQESALGEMPSGWTLSTLNQEVAEVVGGDWGQERSTGDHCEPALCIRGADIPSLQSGGFGKMPTRYLKPSSLARRRLKHGDIVFEISGGSPTQATGRVVLIDSALLRRSRVPLVCSNFCRLVRPRTLGMSRFLYLWLRLLYSQDEMYQYETGTTGIKNFGFTFFAESKEFVLPSVRLLAKFDDLVGTLFGKIAICAAEVESLGSLLNTLLPKLISGELTVQRLRKVQ